MTIIIGLKCANGVVVGSDQIATMGGLGVPTVEQRMQKLEIIKDRVIMGVSGFTGLEQKLVGAVTRTWADDLSKNDTLAARDKIREAMWEQTKPELEAGGIASRLVGQQVAAMSAICETVIALPLQKRAVLLHFDQQCASQEVTEELPFVSIGSGRAIADLFLAFIKRTLWGDKCPSSVGEGVFAVLWTLTHVIDSNPSGGIGGNPQIAVLEQEGAGWKASLVPDDFLQERRQAIKGAEDALSEYVRGLYPPPVDS